METSEGNKLNSINNIVLLITWVSNPNENPGHGFEQLSISGSRQVLAVGYHGNKL